MPEFYYPTQNRYNDVYHQDITVYGTAYKQKYLSRAANHLLKMVGDNLVVTGLTLTATAVGPNVTLSFTPGIVIHDSTLVEFTTTSILTADLSLFGDTPSHGCYLGVFADFEYVETPDVDSQTLLKLSVFHVAPGGIPTSFTGSPIFSTTRNKLLIAKIEFTKSGSDVILISEVPWTYDLETSSMIVSGELYYIRGANSQNFNCSGLPLTPDIEWMIKELLFHDNIC